MFSIRNASNEIFFVFFLFRFQEKEKDLSQIDLSEDRRARRRMSSAEYLDGSLGEVVTSPETTSVQNRLLDIVGSCLSAFLALSPGNNNLMSMLNYFNIRFK